MIKYVKNNRQKIIIAIITFVMIISAIPFISLADNPNPSTTTKITANVDCGKIQNSTENNKTEISFTVKDSLGIKSIYWIWDRDFKPQKECERGVLHPEGYPNDLPTEYTFSMPVDFPEDDLGLHVFSFYVVNGENKQTNFDNFPFNVVKEKDPNEPKDVDQVKFYGVGTAGCPESGSTIEPNRKFQLYLEDENHIYFFLHKWVEGSTPTNDWLGDNPEINYKPENNTVEFYAPSKPGTYVLQFYAVDGANNIPEGHYYIYNVADEQPPVLTLNDPDNNDVPLGGTYVDPGAEWTDNVDGTGTETIYSEDKVDTSIVGPQTITYTKTDSAGNVGTITRTVTVVGTEPSYKLTLPSKTEYKYGEEIDLSDAQLLYIDERGALIREETVTPDMFIDFTTTEFNDISKMTETKQAKFQYGGQTLVYNYTVTQSLNNIEVSKNPTKTVYEYGDTLDLDGGELSLVYQTGYTETVDLKDATIKIFDPNLVGTSQIVVVTYNNRDADFNVTINKRNVTITVDSAESFYGEEIQPINYSLSSDSSLAYEDTLDDLGITVSTTATSTSNVGEYPIVVENTNNKYNVTIVGDAKYQVKAIPLVDDDLTVTIPDNLIYDGLAKTVNVTVSENKTVTTEITYTGKNTTDGSAINAGDYTATVTITGTGNYTGTITKTVNFTISAKSLTITANDASSLYGAPITTNGYTITDSEGNVITDSGLTVDLTVNNVTSSSDAKTYEGAIVANVTAGNEDNHYAITYIAGNYTINPVSLKASDITVSDPSIFVYDGTAKTVNVTMNNNKTANIEIVYTGANVTSGSAINAGNYTANITVTGTGNYTGTITKKVDLIINAKSLTITANDVTADFGTEVTTNGYTITDSEGNIITDSELNVNLVVDTSITNTTNAGTYTNVITPNVTSGNESNNYKITYVTGDYTINPAPLIDTDLSITAPADLIYNGSAKTVTVNANTNKTFNTEITYTGNNITDGNAINVGDYTVTVTITGTGNYTGTITKSVDFTIEGKALTVTANNASSEYGKTITANGYTITDSEGNEFANPGLVIATTVDSTITSSSDAKIYEKAISVDVTSGNENNNYDITLIPGDYTITPAPLNDDDVIVTNPDNLIFDGTAKKVNVTLSNGKTGSINIIYEGNNVTDNQAINVGDYTATITVTGTDNYTGTITKVANFTITGETLTIKVNNASSEYGAPINANGYTITDSEGNTIENEDLIVELSIDETVTSTSNVGIYKGVISATVISGNEDNYSITYLPGDYEIKVATITESDITFNIPGEPLDATYNGVKYDSKVQTASLSITKNNILLEENTDYTLSTAYAVWDSVAGKYVSLEDGKLPTDVATYRVTFVVNGKGNYTGKVSKNRFYRIQSSEITEENVTFNFPGEPLDATYNGVEYNSKPQLGTVSVSKNDITLEKDIDYTLTETYAIWDSVAKKYVTLDEGNLPTDVGTYRVTLTVTGIGNYTGRVTGTKFYRIQASTITEENITFNFPGQPLDNTYYGVEYDPNGHAATVEINKNDVTLTENTDYTATITYSSWDAAAQKYLPLEEGKIPTEMGAYRIAIVVKGIGNYTGSVSKTQYIKIQQQQIKEEDIQITIPTDLEYNGEAKEVTVNILNGKTASYTITYAGTNLTDGKAVKVGEYTVTVVAKGTGEFGGEVTKTETFTIIDTQIPVITVTGDEEVTIEVNTEYLDAGATANDNYDGDISDRIIVDSTDVDVTKLGTYYVTYNVTDSNGNKAEQVTRTVTVVDTTAPIVTINGAQLIVIEKGKTYTLPTATAVDNYDGPIEEVTNDASKIDTNVPGEYTITYSATDSSSNTGTNTVTLRVLDFTKLYREENKLKSLDTFVTEDPFDALNENRNDYTEESLAAKKALIDTVKQEFNDILSGNSTISLEDFTQSYVDTRIKEIEDLSLVPRELDKSQYNDLMDQVADLFQDDYTKETWDDLMERVSADISECKLQSDLNYVSYRIERGIDYLEPIDIYRYVTLTTNDCLSDFWDNYIKSDYTKESYEAIEDSIFNLAFATKPYGGYIELKSEFDRLLNEIVSDIDNRLVPKEVDQSALDAIENAMAELNPAHYTPESWEALTNKIAEARKITDLQSKFDKAMEDISLDDLEILDNEPPVITVTGDEEVTIEVDTEYVDAGATAYDNYDEDITANIVVDNDVDTTTVGTYYVTYNVTDSNGNKAVEVVRTVKVKDSQKPVISIDDDNNTYSMKAGETIPEFKATATDNYDGPVKVEVTTDIKVNTPGKYTVTFTATDSNGNTATETREFIVINSIAPVITVDENNKYTMEVKGTIPTLNATAEDVDGNEVEVTVDYSDIDATTVGTYFVTFIAIDLNDNKAEVTKEFKVIDTTKPVITVDDDNNTYSMEVKGTKPTFTATATDNYDGTVKVEVTDNINVNVVGKYTITFTATDSNGNIETETRNFEVFDKTIPVITITGKEEVTVEVGTEYKDEGATANDNYDENISAKIVTDSDVDTTTIGTYYVTYNVTDASGNKAEQVIRTVHVVDTTAPTITLDSTNNYSMEINTTIPTFKFTATDNYDGTITEKVIVDTSKVDVTKVGIYKVTFTVTDNSNNSTVVEKDFEVIDTQDPEIILDENNVYTMKVGETKPELKATAIDNSKESIIVDIKDNIDITAPGTYQVTFTAKDSAGNTTIITKDFIVLEADKLDINMDGITIVDTKPEYTSPVKAAKLSVDTLPEGIIDVTYEYTDSEGNIVTPVNAGTYNVRAIFTVDTKVYNPVNDILGTLTIEKSNYNMSGVVFKDAEYIYDETNPVERSLAIEGTLPNGVIVAGYENNGRTIIGSQVVTVKFAVTDTLNYNVPADMKATLTIKEDYMNNLSLAVTGSKTYKSGQAITREDILGIISLSKEMASGKVYELSADELANVQFSVNGNPLPVDTTPYAGTKLTVTVTFNGKNADVSVFVEGTTIEYVANDVKTPLRAEATKKFGRKSDTPIVGTIQWSSGETGILTDSNGIITNVSSGFELQSLASGEYTLTVGNSTRTFVIIDETFNRYLPTTATGSVTISNSEDIESIQIGDTIFTQETGIPTSYTFEAVGRYNVIITTKTGLSITGNIRVRL